MVDQIKNNNKLQVLFFLIFAHLFQKLLVSNLSEN